MERYEGKPYEWVKVDREKCSSCGACVELCPRDVLRLDGKGNPYMAYRDDCWYCDVDRGIDPPSGSSGALRLESLESVFLSWFLFWYWLPCSQGAAGEKKNLRAASLTVRPPAK